MFLKSTLLALAAVAALGTTALTSTSADAKGFHKGGHHGFHGSFHGSHFGYHGHHRRHFHGHYWRHRQVYYVPRPVVYRAAPVIAAPRITCLTKEYLPTGAVLFKDNCTGESAMNPPPAPLQTGYAPQMVPQQQ